MKIPVRNVIGLDFEFAKKILESYSLEFKEVDDSSFLHNQVTFYDVDEERRKVVLYINNRKENSFSHDEKIDYVNNLGFVTGRNSINKGLFESRNIGSTDLGICVDDHETTLFLYGDSFSGIDCNKGIWNSNFLASAKQKSYSQNIKFDDIVAYPNGLAKPIIQGIHDENLQSNMNSDHFSEVTKIPTGGIRIGDYIYVFYMSVKYWGKPGEWFINYNQGLKAEYYGLSNFKKIDSLCFDNSLNDQFGQIYPFDNPFDKKHIYFLACPGGRFGNTCLLRVKVKDFEDAGKYCILTKNKEFSNIQKTDKNDYFYLIEKNESGEQSIMFNPYLKKWMISNLNKQGICLYLSDDLFDEFDEIVEVVNCNDFPMLYGGFIHPKMADNDGKRIYMQISQWSPIYNTSLLEIVFK